MDKVEFGHRKNYFLIFSLVFFPKILLYRDLILNYVVNMPVLVEMQAFVT